MDPPPPVPAQTETPHPGSSSSDLQSAASLSYLYLLPGWRPKVLYRKDCKVSEFTYRFPWAGRVQLFLKRGGCSPFSDYPEVGVMVQAFAQRF